MTTGMDAHPLFERITRECGIAAVDAAAFDAFAAAPGDLLLFFADDPQRIRETLDLAVIFPELAAEFAGRLRAGVLLPRAANAVAPRFGIRRWPALVLLRDGEYVGAVEGIRDWADYRFQIARLLEIEASAPPRAAAPRKDAATEPQETGETR